MGYNTDMLLRVFGKMHFVHTRTFHILSYSQKYPEVTLFNFQWIRVTKSNFHFCVKSLNRLLKTVEKVDDFSNSDKVKSAEFGL